MRKLDAALHEKLLKLIVSMGFELVGCEVIPAGRRHTFRIFIDCEKGVTIDDCSRLSRQVGAMLDVEGTFYGQYTLEVSSPGVDRPLFELAHYQKYIGSQVKIRLSAAVAQKRQYKGVLERVEGQNIYLLVDGNEKAIVLPFSAIEKGNLINKVGI